MKGSASEVFLSTNCNFISANIFLTQKNKSKHVQHHFFVNVKSNICSEMSCLLKQWLVIKCTEDALHLPQCTSMYVYKIYITSSSSLCTLSHSSFVSLPFKKVMGKGGGAYFNGAWPRGWMLTWGRVPIRGQARALFEEICCCA